MTSKVDYDIIVVGAGLAGSLSAVLLTKRGYTVLLVERNDDPRTNDVEDMDEESNEFGNSKSAIRRSINLALSVRGEEALQRAGILQDVLKQTIFMPRRVIHSTDGEVTFQPYGKKGQGIRSVGREMLNIKLLDLASTSPHVTIKFNYTLDQVSRDGSCFFNGNSEPVTSHLVIGADGAYSTVRKYLMRYSRANFSRRYIEHSYKEISIPATAAGEYALKNYDGLHIWPRDEFMMIALPNPDKSFTGTMFAPNTLFEELENKSLSSTDKSKKVNAFFQQYFSDFKALVPDVEGEFERNPTGPLVTVSVNPWNYYDKILILGDAAHACVPFYGQGMNAAFEDVLEFDNMLNKCRVSLPTTVTKQMILKDAVPKFARSRRDDGDAIAALSYGNYAEMRAHTASKLFLWRKRFEGYIHWLFPRWWIPQYTMVAFTRIPYSTVVKLSKRQDKMIWPIFVSVVASLALGLEFSLLKLGRSFFSTNSLSR